MPGSVYLHTCAWRGYVVVCACFYLVFFNLPDMETLSSCCGNPPTIKLFSLLIHNCIFANTMNCNVNIGIFWWSEVAPVKGPFDPEGVATHSLRTADLRTCVCLCVYGWMCTHAHIHAVFMGTCMHGIIYASCIWAGNLWPSLFISVV